MPKTKPAKDAPEWAAKLTTRERVFVEHYIISLNATKAAIAAGYSKGASVRGHDRSPAVAEAVATILIGSSSGKPAVGDFLLGP